MDTWFWVKKLKDRQAILMPHTQIYYKVNDNNELRLKICKDSLLTIPSVMYTSKNFFLLPAINEALENFKAGGLIEYWHSMAFDRKHMKTEVKSYPKVLSMKHLSGCFEMWMTGCLISFSVLMLELFLGRKNRST
jgi:hypothetical protein